MSGIVGIRRFDGALVDERLLRAMAERLRHRGPDGDGFRVMGAVGFGHTRLAVHDPPGSPQPMTSASGPFHLTCDGGICNHQERRRVLQRAGVSMRTQGDTEVLLETLRTEGLRGLESLNGQFAFGYFDEHEGRLLLVRDRLGILPLYFAQRPGFLVFASEIKALLPALGEPELDDDAVESYLTCRSVAPPRTLFRGIGKLPPGTALWVGADGATRQETWWRLPATGSAPVLTGDAAVTAVEQALERAVAGRLVADVPVGACFSGGLSSSLTVALMKKLRGGGQVQTFAAGCADPRFDELPYARQVAKALSTTHHEVVVTPDDFHARWLKLSWHRDGPIGEPADIASYMIAQCARLTVKVLLSAAGGDELFADRARQRFETKAAAAMLPAFVRVPLMRGLERWLPESSHEARRVARALTGRDAAERLQAWFAPFTWYERAALRAGYGVQQSAGPDDCHARSVDHLLERGDRMSMAASIEHRPPFFDHELVETAFRVASASKVRGGGNPIVEQIARRHLPAEIVDRRRVGFRVPLADWFRTSLREYLYDHLLGSDAFVSRYFERAAVEGLIGGHLSGRRNDEQRLWTLLSFEVWHRAFLRSESRYRGPALAALV